MNPGVIDRVLTGIAVGDAVGYELEFNPTPTKEDFEHAWAFDRLVSDDTQMTLFCMESLCIGRHPIWAYKDWYRTQTGQGPVTGQGLLSFREMFALRAPGNTCMGAMRDLQTKTVVQNNSKGNGTVMRAAPYALMGMHNEIPVDNAVGAAEKDALITHKHPYAPLSSGALVRLYYLLDEGLGIEEAWDRVCHRAKADGYLPPQWKAPLESARSGMQGWVAEEALMMAVCAVRDGVTFKEVVQLAATAPNADSDTVASIAGGLAVIAGAPCPISRDELDVARPIAYVLSLVH